MTDRHDRGTPSPDKINISGHDATGSTDRSSIAGAAHDAYWRQRYAERGYTDADRGYEYYRPAYRFGWESRERNASRSFTEVEEELRRDWDRDRFGLDWDEALPAIRDAYERRSNTEFSDPGNPLA